MTKMSKTAQQLGLPTGDAVLRNGKVSVLPQVTRWTVIGRPT